MGLTGFILSLISLIGCVGILSPFSLIFSLIGLQKEPKGFAIAGLVLSIIGLLWFGLFFFGGLIGIVLGAIGLGILVAVVVLAAQVGENAVDIVESVRDYYEAEGRVPAMLTELDMEPGSLTDNWGNRFVYIPSENGREFLLVSAGPDEEYGTGDDWVGELNADEWFEFNVGQGYADREAEWPDLRSRVIAESEMFESREPPAPPETPDASEPAPDERM
jgi:hypothetical protein